MDESCDIFIPLQQNEVVISLSEVTSSEEFGHVSTMERRKDGELAAIVTSDQKRLLKKTLYNVAALLGLRVALLEFAVEV